LRLDRDPLKELAEIKGTAGSGHFNDKVWVSPGLPFIVFIVAGLVLSIVFGDIIWYGVSAVMRGLASMI
jgi:prepilin signal peptidase PulO-like enzyme (type II secretory pathway)